MVTLKLQVGDGPVRVWRWEGWRGWLLALTGRLPSEIEAGWDDHADSDERCGWRQALGYYCELRKGHGGPHNG